MSDAYFKKIIDEWNTKIIDSLWWKEYNKRIDEKLKKAINSLIYASDNILEIKKNQGKVEFIEKVLKNLPHDIEKDCLDKMSRKEDKT